MLPSHHPCQTSAHYLCILIKFSAKHPQISSHVFNPLFNKNNFIKADKSEAQTGWLHSLTSHVWMVFIQLIWKQPSSQESFKLFITSPSCKGTLEHMHALDNSISSWMSLLEKLVNSSLMLFTVLNDVQHSKQIKILIKVQSNMIQHHNEVEIVNGSCSFTVMGLQCSWQLLYVVRSWLSQLFYSAMSWKSCTALQCKFCCLEQVLKHFCNCIFTAKILVWTYDRAYTFLYISL